MAFIKNEVVPLDIIVKNYNALICDIWGVIHDGYAPYENSIIFLNKIVAEGKRITLLSNTPRPGSLSKKQLLDWGINMDKIDIYTSGDAVREQLVSWSDEVFSKLGRKFYHLGEDRNKDILSGLDVDLTSDLKEADFLLLTLYMDDDENIDQYDSLLEEAAGLKLPVVCANPDLIANHGFQMRYCAGTFAEKYKKLGGIVYYYGKPYSQVFNVIINKYAMMGISDKKKILMIGDTMDTDILGANSAGIDSALVVTGNGKHIYNKIKADKQNIFDSYEARPTWISYGMQREY